MRDEVTCIPNNGNQIATLTVNPCSAYRLLKACRAMEYDEFRTSIICSRYDGQVGQLMTHMNTCTTLWNRDINSSRNSNTRRGFTYLNSNNGNCYPLFNNNNVRGVRRR
ncbi:9860_t:CDS:2 [Entrophospora sp. SA101]|nr:9860_t:CDS:2 [Entrophospora sp. SA101]